MLTGDICRVLKIARATLQDWIESEAVVPMEPSGKIRGRGASLRFSPVQLVGLAYAMALRDAGCKRNWAVAAARFVAENTSNELRQAFTEGRTLPTMAPLPVGSRSPCEGRLVRPEDPDSRYDLGRVYSGVVQALREAAANVAKEGETEMALRLNTAAAELSGASATGTQRERRTVGGPA
jgi:hypothetical protein